MTIDAEVIVVGLGVGGEFMAGRLAEAGLDVVGIEPALVGGECPYWGCVPSKMIIRAANSLAETRRAGKLAGHATVEPDWSIVAQRIREEATDDWDDTVGVELAQAFARFGTAVTIVEAADRLLPVEEPETGELIGEVLRGKASAS